MGVVTHEIALTVTDENSHRKLQNVAANSWGVRRSDDNSRKKSKTDVETARVFGNKLFSTCSVATGCSRYAL